VRPHPKRLAIWTFLAVVLALFCTSTAVAQSNPLANIEQKQQALFERVAPSVVFISRTDTFGSGFFVSQEGTILTNAHVVGDAERVDVVTHGGTRTTGEVVERADDLDLALVRIDLEDDVPVVDLTGMDELKVGSWVASVGHGSGGIWSFTTGMVSNIYPDGEQRPVFQTQIPINRGASGGPVIDRKGRAVGIVTSGLEEANDINFAIPVKMGMKHFEALAGYCDCLTVRAPENAPIFVDGTMVGTGPRIVVPADETTYEVFTVADGDRRETEASWPETRTVDLTGEGDSD
jgi:S1-C subfamily serine protease